MGNISTELEVFATCGARWRLRTTSRHPGVVNAGLIAQYQGTGLPTAGFGTVAPRAFAGDPSGTSTWSPPV